MAVNPTLLRAIAGLLQKQSGKDISIPPTGRQGTVVGGEWRPQTHKERKFERVDDPESAGPGVQSKLIDVEEGRLVRDIEHIMPESGRGTVSPQQQVANLTRQLLIGVEQGRISPSSPLLKELLEAVDEIPLDPRVMKAQQFKNVEDVPAGPMTKEVAPELVALMKKQDLGMTSTRGGKMAMSDEGGLVGTMERVLQGKATPSWGATTSYDNMHEMIMRMLTKEGVPPTRARSIAQDVIPYEPGAVSASDKASAGQRAIQKGIEALQGKDFPYEGGSGLAAMDVTNRLQGAGRGGMGGSERVLLRTIMGDPNVSPKLRRALGEAVYLKGGKEAEAVAEAVASGRKEALGTRGVATGYGTRRTREALDRGPTEIPDAPVPPESIFAKTGRSSQLDDIAAKSDKRLKGEQYAMDPETVPYYRASDYVDRTPPKKRPTTAERALVDRRAGIAANQVPESAPIKTGDIVGPRLKRGDTMDLEGTGLAENQAQHMFDLKNTIDDQLDDLLKTTRGMEKTPEAVPGMAFEPKAPLPRRPGETNAQYNKRLAKTGTFTFRDQVKDTKKALAAAYEKQDFDEVVNISHRLDKGEFSSPPSPPKQIRGGLRDEYGQAPAYTQGDIEIQLGRLRERYKGASPKERKTIEAEAAALKKEGAEMMKGQYPSKRDPVVLPEDYPQPQSKFAADAEAELGKLRTRWKNASPEERKAIESEARTIDYLRREEGMAELRHLPPPKKIQYEPKPSKALSKESAQEATALKNIEKDLAELRLQWKESKNPVARKMIESKAAELTSLLERL